jgi:hypothetical protein
VPVRKKHARNEQDSKRKEARVGMQNLPGTNDLKRQLKVN